MDRTSHACAIFVALGSLSLGCCASDEADVLEHPSSARASVPQLVENLIQFPQLFSAYDGEHSYRVAANVPLADPNSSESQASDSGEAIDARSLKWSIDDDYLDLQDYTALPGAALLTTKQAGSTTIRVEAMTTEGKPVHGEARLEISEATAEEWTTGDERYNRPMIIIESWPRKPVAPGEAQCGLPSAVALPKNASCINCHNETLRISTEYTPVRTARYSDEQLIGIFARGEVPADGVAPGPFLENVAMAECVFMLMHTPDDIDDKTARGLLWKLRSLEPKPPMEMPGPRVVR